MGSWVEIICCCAYSADGIGGGLSDYHLADKQWQLLAQYLIVCLLKGSDERLIRTCMHTFPILSFPYRLVPYLQPKSIVKILSLPWLARVSL